MESTNSTNQVENNETEDDKDSSSSEENEPKLKYVRMSNDLQHILLKDLVSCVAVHPKFVCVGTHWGIIHLLDHQGNSIPNKELRNHTVTVNQISIDANGDHIASCSDDGKVFVYGLYNSNNNHELTIGRLVRSVAIDPFYYKSSSGRRFITGDERLVLHEKVFLSRRSTVLSDASHEGGVTGTKWSPGGDTIAWSTHFGFRVYDIATRVSLGLIKWSKTSQVDVKSHLCWKDEGMLIVGWSDTVRVCMVHRRSPQLTSPADTSPYLVQLVYIFQTDFILCGVGPLGDSLVALGSVKDSERPQLHVIDPAPQDYTDLSTDILSLRGYQQYTSADYSLECLIEENRYVIVSPKDIVVACPYDADDRIDWLLEHCKFEEALEAINEATEPLVKHSLISIGRAYLDHLLTVEEYQQAARLCSKILGKNKGLWEKEVYKFARVHQLRAVSRYLPKGDDKLTPHIYEMVLYEYLKLEPQGFLSIVKDWPAALYNVPAVVSAVLDHLLVTDPTAKPVLLEALAILYSHEGKHDKALATYIKLGNKGVFELIKRNNIYGSLYESVEGLMGLDPKQTLDTLLESREIKPHLIVQRLSCNNYYLYQYLDRLNEKDKKACQRWHGELVKLYADFCKGKLLALLKNSDHYPIQEALDICRFRNFHHEMIHLLERIGNFKEALSVITKQLGNIEEAINFCKRHDDHELWEDLITYSLENPAFITFLLKRIGTYVDPRMLVKRIKNKLEIPGLKDALVKMLHDYNLQVSVQEGFKKIVVSDYFDLFDRLVSIQQRGTYIGDDQFCGSCLHKVLVKGGKESDQTGDLVLFHCNHLFHTKCLPPKVTTCSICTSQKPGHPFSLNQS